MRTQPTPFTVAALLAIAATFVTPASQADSVYKSTLPDGHVVYGSAPAKGAAKVQKLAPAAPVVEVESQAAEAQRQREKAQAAELDKRLATRQSAHEKADGAIRAAEDTLAAAEKALAAGREALPGERMATADGGSRLSEGHFERLKGLENDVSAAQERLDKARRERNELH